MCCESCDNIIIIYIIIIVYFIIISIVIKYYVPRFISISLNIVWI